MPKKIPAVRFKKIFNKWYFICLISLLVFSYIQMRQLPKPYDILPALLEEPQQTETTQQPFKLTKKNVTYTIKPLYDYDLSGLIVSCRYTQGFVNYYHKNWGDVINVKDVCVIWGDNLKNFAYQKFKFKSSSWTCYYHTKNRAAYDQFKTNKFSNNHLLSADKNLLKKMLVAKKGDQVHFKGYLAEYSHDGGFKRGSSVSREDTGGTACETVFVKEFEIIKEGHPFWRRVYQFGKIVFLASLVLIVLDIVVNPVSFRA
ncbi:MAG: hypothetical protein K8S27_09400 [Candidatus Omnitrophica bacterium]|nr:hypothetical protein [Candidatus Omnitrophota bacterium]